VPQFVIKAPQSLGGALWSALTMRLNWYEGWTHAWLPGGWDVLWSLSIEEVFYLALPAVCLLLRGPWLVAALGVLVLSLPWTRQALQGREIWQEKAYLPGMSAIALGVLAALLARRWSPHRRTARWLGGLGVVALWATFVYGGVLWRLMHDAVMLLLCAGAACWLVAVQGSRRAAPRGLPWLAAMGRNSYEIYLSHMLIVLPVTGLYRQVFGDDLRWTVFVYPLALAACAWAGGGLNVLMGRLQHRMLG
jgi:peptidoglycan/LPS O-acetylase OafA/YrhL